MELIDIGCNLIIYLLLLIIVILYFVYNYKKYTMIESFKMKKKHRRKLKSIDVIKKIKKSVKQDIRNANKNNNLSNPFNNVVACNKKCNRKLQTKDKICKRQINSITKNNNQILKQNHNKCKTKINQIKNKTKKIINTKDEELLDLQNIVDSLEQSLVNEKIKSSNLELQLKDNKEQLDRIKNNAIEMRTTNFSL